METTLTATFDVPATLYYSQSGDDLTSLAGRFMLVFHETVARASLRGARKLRQATGVSRIALSGGVFQNLLLRELLVPLLIKDGFEVFLNVQVPPGDGGLSVGQAWFQES